MARGVGLQLGPVHRDVAEPHETSGAAKPQDLHEQVRQNGEMALAEIRDSAEVRAVQSRHRHDVDPLLAGAGQLTRGVDPAAVAVKQQGGHHAGMIGREAALLAIAV